MVPELPISAKTSFPGVTVSLEVGIGGCFGVEARVFVVSAKNAALD